MPTTGHGISYIDPGDQVDLDADIQQLADSVETALDVYETFNSWTPTFNSGGFTNFGGSGFNQGFYSQIGKLVHAQFRMEIASGFAVSAGLFVLNLPVTAFAWSGANNAATIGSWLLRDDSVPRHYSGGILTVTSGGGARVWFGGAWDTSPAPDAPSGRVSDTEPVTWAAGDVLSGTLRYRAA